MEKDLSPLAAARLAVLNASPRVVVERVLNKANSNLGKNVYLSIDADWTLREADALGSRGPSESMPLFGIPVALKDCFDLAGFRTSCGSRFYAEQNGIAREDSWVAARLRKIGAVIVGKTHMHQLAWGITGENSEYGDCLQPANPRALTGGSSSGSAAAVQEGSAIAAIGTDTGGSIRAPAAFCGLAGYRATLGLGSWQGGAHLAQSFDTLGWLYRDLRDGPALALALFGIELATAKLPLRIAVVKGGFLHDCEPAVLRLYEDWQRKLCTTGAELCDYEPDFWNDAQEIFAGIQAHEAAKLHRGYFDEFEPTIAERLTWGESLSEETVKKLRVRHARFRDRMDGLLVQFDCLLLPCTPVSGLTAGADHSSARKTILRYTIPISLAGMPVVTLPGTGGVQLVGPRGSDGWLLDFSARLHS